MKSLLISCLFVFLTGELFAQTWHSKIDHTSQSEDGGAMGTIGNVGIGFHSSGLSHPSPNINLQPEVPYLPQKQLHILGFEDEENPGFIAPVPAIRLDHRTISETTGNGNNGNSTNRVGGPSPNSFLEFNIQQHVWDIENNKGTLGFAKDGNQKVRYTNGHADFGIPVNGGDYDVNVYGTFKIGLNPEFDPSDLIVNGPSTLKGILKSQNEAYFENQVVIGDPSTIYSAQANPSIKLIVQGTGVFQEVVVDHVTEWNDKVFKDDYQLLNLSDLESFIRKNGHLPEIPKEELVKKNGYDMAEMDALLLKKIEELTLHLIELNKENEILKSRIK